MGHSKLLTIPDYLLVPKFMSKNHYQRVLHICKSWENEKWLWESMLEKRSMKAVKEEEVGVWITCEFLHFATKQGHEGSINNIVIVSSDLPKGRRFPWRFGYPTSHHKWSNTHHRTFTPALQTGAGALPWCSDGHSLHSDVLNLLCDKSSPKFSKNVGNPPTHPAQGFGYKQTTGRLGFRLHNQQLLRVLGFWVFGYQLYSSKTICIRRTVCNIKPPTKSPKCGLTHPTKEIFG